MIRLLYLSSLLQITAASFGQRIVNNEITPSHVRVEATNVFLIPPRDFTWSSAGRRFLSSPPGASILVNDLPTPVDVVYAEMSEKGLAAQGLRLISREPLSLNGLPGFVVKASRKANLDNSLIYTLILGDVFQKTQVTHVIQCIFPGKDQDMKVRMEGTLFTAVYKSAVAVAPPAFSFDLKKNDFSFWKSAGGIEYFKSFEPGDSLTVTVDHFFTKSQMELELIFRNRISRLPYTSTALAEQGLEEVTLNGLPGVQATLTGANERNKTVFIYQVLLFQDQNFFCIQGTSATVEGQSRIKELVKTFRTKS